MAKHIHVHIGGKTKDDATSDVNSILGQMKTIQGQMQNITASTDVNVLDKMFNSAGKLGELSKQLQKALSKARMGL